MIKSIIGAFVAILFFSSNSYAQQRLSELDMNNASQTYGAVMIGKTVTGEEPIVAGEKCADAVGVYPQNTIRINAKGFGYDLEGKIGVADSNIDYNAANISSNPQPDGTKVFYHTVNGIKYFAGVEDADREHREGSVVFRIVGDGKELFSKKMVQGEKPQPIKVNIRNVKNLELTVDNAGDGYWGDFAIWSDVTMTFNVHQAVTLSTSSTEQNSGVAKNDWEKMRAKLESLPVANYSTTAKCEDDWLINADRFKAGVWAGEDGKSILISNGLVSRVFRITPNLATINIVNQMSNESMLRAVSSEGELTINGIRWHLGGLDGQPERGYLKSEWIEQMTPKSHSFIVEDFEIRDSIHTLKWARSRWALNKRLPTGKSLVFTLRGVDEVKNVKVKLYFDIYDHIPIIRKHLEVINNGDTPINLDSFKLENLAFVEPESPVEEQDPKEFIHPNIHVESDYHVGPGFTERETNSVVHWVADKDYTSQTSYTLKTPCVLDVSLDIGPDVEISREQPFASYKVYEMPMDSYDRERMGLFKRRMQLTIAPWTSENPIFMHLTSTNPEVVKRAVDQCVECGYEMVILSFGSGLNAEDISEENIARFKELVDYANSRGIELGCYSLLASRWISDDVDIINPKTGKRGGMTFGSSPCLCSDWGYEYFHKIKTFIERTGMTCFEHDGSYPGNVCASTSHTHHKGLNDSQWRQFQKITELYNWMCEKGVYINVPDYYFLNGSTKVGIGYREVNWSLPRERQLIHTRQLNYRCTWERLPSSLWSFVPLVQYHGGGAAATLEPLSEHLYEYRTLMFQNYGAGVQACYRGPRLYDTEETKQVVIDVISWYKRYREILNSDIIHLRQPDARDWDGIMHINPNLKEKALAMFFNPTDQEMIRTIKVPLYYTGLDKIAKIREQEGRSKNYKIDRNYYVTLEVVIPANGYTWYVVE
ncbi:MAG: NPCBM/NEW2 domain-containing protein [Alistipes sp.]|nr:NPCBM/NEW2 domain-containing protein [Alistipes sp.]